MVMNSKRKLKSGSVSRLDQSDSMNSSTYKKMNKSVTLKKAKRYQQKLASLSINHEKRKKKKQASHSFFVTKSFLDFDTL